MDDSVGGLGARSRERAASPASVRCVREDCGRPVVDLVIGSMAARVARPIGPGTMPGGEIDLDAARIDDGTGRNPGMAGGLRSTRSITAGRGAAGSVPTSASASGLACCVALPAAGPRG